MRTLLLSAMPLSLASALLAAHVPPSRNLLINIDDRIEVPIPEPELQKVAEYRLRSYCETACTNSDFLPIRPDRRKGHMRHNQEPFYANVAYRKRSRR